jgi:hypothetical protein
VAGSSKYDQVLIIQLMIRAKLLPQEWKEVFPMTDLKGRFLALILTTILLVSALMMIIGAPEDVNASEEPPTRADKHYLGQTFTKNYDWVEEDLWMVVFAQSLDDYRGTDVGDGSRFYNYMEVGNSFMFPLDGDLHNSGNIRRPLVELFTATDCDYCPSSEESLDNILQTRGTNDFTLIEWHEGLAAGADPYQTGGAESRINRYNVTGKPTVIFDGQSGRAGGDSSVQSPELVQAYNDAINRFSVYDPYMTLSGSASITGDQVSFNVSFEVIDALPQGTWALYAVIVEDLQKEHKDATMRFTQRKSYSKSFADLQEDHPSIILDKEATYSPINVKKAMGNISLVWDASDPQDVTSLDIDIIYSRPGQAWETLVEGVPNIGSYLWDTNTVEDNKYLIRVIAEDSDGNRVMSADRFVITVNNPDLPVMELIYPMEGDSLSRSAPLKWNSSDDEDIMTDLLMKISIRNTTDDDWIPITFNINTFEDFIANSGTYNFNTEVWPDIDTYQLKFELRDKDDMITEVVSGVIEIYNNDKPIATLIGPVEDEVVTETLEVSWKVEDEEDGSWGLVDQMMANFSVLKNGETEWITLFLDHVDLDMENKTFPTSALMGDGEYTLRFTVTDTRGMNHQVERAFIVYDPDAPEFIGAVEGPADTSDLKVETLSISWDASDPDSDEILTYNIEISLVEVDNWTLVAEGVTNTSYDLDLTTLDQGRYKLRITAVDDSDNEMSTSIEYGPFYYNAPDAPEVNWIYPENGFTGIIEDDLGIANETGFFNIGVVWSGSDPDGDNVTYSIYWKTEAATDWDLLLKDATDTLYDWNVTTFTDGTYMLRIVARDTSSDHLTSEFLLGPFSIDIPWDPPADDDDDMIGDDDVQTDDGVNVGVIIVIAIGSVVLVVLIVVIILVVMNKTTGKKSETPVIPSQRDVDLSIPDFDRPYEQQAVTSGQMVSQGPYTGVQQQVEQEPPQEQLPTQEGAQPIQQIDGQVSWEGEQNTPVPEQVQPEQIPEQAQPVMEQPVIQEPAPIAPPPAIPEMPQGPPPLPPQD